MKNSHSPLPWHVGDSTVAVGNRTFIGIGNGATHIGYASITGCIGPIEAKSNARLIVRAVNSHQALVDALKECRSYLDLKIAGFRQDYPEDHCMVQTPIRLQATVDTALALATK